MGMSGKKILMIGVFCVVGAFLCVVGVFYFMFAAQQEKTFEVQSLEERLLAADTERDIAQQEAAELRQKVGQSIYLEKLLQESARYYGPDEESKREGFLWIDRESDMLLVTLGALNGLDRGHVLRVLDGDDPVGEVKVQTPLDVISYVNPVGQSMEDLPKDYYRVVWEQVL